MPTVHLHLTLAHSNQLYLKHFGWLKWPQSCSTQTLDIDSSWDIDASSQFTDVLYKEKTPHRVAGNFGGELKLKSAKDPFRFLF